MEQKFINYVIQDLYLKYKEKFSDLTIILPAKRAKIFLKEAISKEIKDTIWLPEIVNIVDFLEFSTNLRIIDKTELLLEFYNSYCSVEKNPIKLQEFLNWAPTALSDFSEIDSYLINEKDFFRFIKEIKNIETWNPEDTNKTELQIQYLKFWESLGKYYNALKNNLLNNKTAYQGLAYRYFCENKEKIFNSSEFNEKFSGKIIFIGFNAFNKCEKKIISYLKQIGRVDLYFDSDKYYMEDKLQEAGLFLRKLKQKQGENFKFIFDNLSKPKNIDIYKVNGKVTQTLLANQLLKGKYKKDNSQMAVILADESLLIPMIQGLPNNIDKVNITMGYPVKFSIIYNFIENLIDLFLHVKTKSNDKNLFYHVDLIHILQNQIWSVSNSINQEIHNLKSKIILSNQFLINLENINYNDSFYRLNKKLDTDFKKLFTPLEIESEISNKILQWIELCYDIYEKEAQNYEQKLNLDIIKIAQKTIIQIQKISKQYKINFTIQVFKMFFKQIVNKEKIIFFGEPLGGLQIMGMLETRLLDFEEIIIVSVNEGVLPKGKKNSSLIPYDLKKNYDLPTHYEKDAIFSYYFYRICQRAKRISLIYNANMEGMVKGEKSRFILQIKKELAKKYPNSIKISEKSLELNLKIDKTEENKIIKSSKIIENIKLFLEEKGLSPSSIIEYINSPLDFYYNSLLKIQEEKKIEEASEANTFGEIIHDSLESLYKDELNKILTEKKLKIIKSNVVKEVNIAFQKKYKGVEVSGEIYLSKSIAEKIVKNTIEYDIKRVKEKNEIIIICLEKSIEFKKNIKNINVKFKGKIDRIEKLNGKIHILDYKTGKVDKKELVFTFDELFQSFERETPPKNKFIQLLLYDWMYKNKENINDKINTGIFSIKTKKPEIFIRESIEDETANTEIFIQNIIEELLDDKKEFYRPEFFKYGNI